MESLTKMVVILLSIFGVLLLVLELANVWGADWTTVGQDLSPLVLSIAFFGVVLTIIAVYLRRR